MGITTLHTYLLGKETPLTTP